MTESAWPQIINFRDAGGCPTMDGRRVKRGLIFRGASLNDATDDDLDKLVALGIGLDFDLRSRDEAQGRPDRVPVGVAYRRESAVIWFDEHPRELLDWDVLIDQLSGSERRLADLEAFQVYAEMIQRPNAFAAFVGELLADPSRGVFVHCAAGKDRTGVATAIVLHLLGVGRDAIMADYLESANHPALDAEAVRAKAVARGSRVASVVVPMLGVASSQLDQAFAEVETTWGGWDGFARDGLGLTPGDIDDLRAAYLS
ncbi:MAG: tyrosine-protein phosphatase [Propionibacteriaceae bacterium]|nr:tyrosine-protein phosphatase [Propionibacteriaceae bacterium]